MISEKASGSSVMTNQMGFGSDPFEYAKKLGFGELHFKFDKKSGLNAIIAIHSTKLGPSLGGCRFLEYSSWQDAINDASRLAQGMSYKNAITGLPLGGGKSVIIKPSHDFDRKALFESFGQFVEDLGGRYITAVDSGTSTEDMDIIASKSRFVTSKTGSHGDPSPFTATGVKQAILAAVKFKLNKDTLDGIRVAIQGIGHVGLYLADELHRLGAQLIITDRNEPAIAECVKRFGAIAVSPDEIYSVDCDIFSPCALGAVINDTTIPRIKASMIIGAANNQLAEPRHGRVLSEKGVLYGPDYVVNAGGVICASAQYHKTPKEIVDQQVANIYNSTLTIFERSAREKRSTSEIADTIAEEILS